MTAQMAMLWDVVDTSSSVITPGRGWARSGTWDAWMPDPLELCGHGVGMGDGTGWHGVGCYCPGGQGAGTTEGDCDALDRRPTLTLLPIRQPE